MFTIRSGKPFHPVDSGRESSGITPTRERANHEPIERLERAIADSSGRPVRPYRAVDTLTAMERRGTITASMRQAGEDFRARFNIAQLDPLSAFDISLFDRRQRGFGLRA